MLRYNLCSIDEGTCGNLANIITYLIVWTPYVQPTQALYVDHSLLSIQYSHLSSINMDDALLETIGNKFVLILFGGAVCIVSERSYRNNFLLKKDKSQIAYFLMISFISLSGVTFAWCQWIELFASFFAIWNMS